MFNKHTEARRIRNENRCYEVDCLECWKREMKEE